MRQGAQTLRPIQCERAAKELRCEAPLSQALSQTRIATERLLNDGPETCDRIARRRLAVRQDAPGPVLEEIVAREGVRK